MPFGKTSGQAQDVRGHVRGSIFFSQSFLVLFWIKPRKNKQSLADGMGTMRNTNFLCERQVALSVVATDNSSGVRAKGILQSFHLLVYLWALMAQQDDNQLKNVVSHAKEYGFIFQSSEIYDGLSAVYDYGQNGVELKNNLKEYWWRFMTQLHDNIVGIDSAIFMHPTV